MTRILAYKIGYQINMIISRSEEKDYSSFSCNSNKRITLDHSMELNKSSLKNINRKNITFLLENVNYFYSCLWINPLFEISYIMNFSIKGKKKIYCLNYLHF